MVLGILIQNELKQILKNRLFYIAVFICYCVCGYLVWISPYNLIESGFASVTFMFNVIHWLLLILIPAITMRRISDEKTSGSFELMLTKPVTIREIITAKWIAIWLETNVAILFSIPYCITISCLGNLDWGIVLCGYIGTFLYSGMLIAISLYASSMSKSSFNALFTTWLISLAVLEGPQIMLLLFNSGLWENILVRISVEEYFSHTIRGLMYIHGALLYMFTTILFIAASCYLLMRRQRSPLRPIRYIVIIALIPVLSFLSSTIPYRIDFSANGRYSLSPVTIQTVKENHTPITVNIFCSENLSESAMRLNREINMLLRSYRSESDAPFEVNVINVDSKESKLIAAKDGISPIIPEDGDNKNGDEVYFGAAIHVGDYNSSVINHISINTAIEYEITRIIRQSSRPEMPSVGFIYGQGESDNNLITLFTNEVSKSADISMVNLDMETSLNDFDVLCIIGPKYPFTQDELSALTHYLQEGGRLFIALQHAIGEIGDPKGSNWFTINRTGLENMLEDMGMKINYNIIVDNNCSSLTIQQPLGTMFATSSIKFPFFPIVTHFSRHTITNGLNSIMLPFASSIEQVKTATTYVFSSLAKTSSISGVQQPPIFFNIQKTWSRNDFNAPNSTVAAMLTNDENRSAVVAITNAMFLHDEVIGMYGSDNVNFAVNSIEWLEDNSGLIQLRNKYTTFPTLEKISETSTNTLKTVNVMIPLILTILAFVASILFEKYKNRHLI